MSDIKAIETIYRGHRFRSRLEARWAVFFDAARIEWAYEPQGFEKDGDRYLPDFRVSIGNRDIWAEVKGDPSWLCGNQDRIDRWFAGDPIVPGGRLLLLGEIPKASKGALLVRGIGSPDGVPSVGWMNLAADGDWNQIFHWPAHVVMYFVRGGDDPENFQPFVVPTAVGYEGISRALEAARMARFEHGESGWL